MIVRRVAIRSAILGAALLAAPGAFAKTPGTTYCYKDICHRVKTITETVGDIGKPSHILASYYDVPWRDPFNPSLMTSSGETFRALDADTAASPIHPDGTRLLVYAPASGGAVVVRVNDAGPYWSGRLLDVSRGAAEKLGFFGRGLAHVVTEVLSAPTSAEARYEAGRTYEPVAGYLGVFANLADARAAWARLPQAQAVAALPPPVDDWANAPARFVVIESGDNATSIGTAVKSGAGAKRPAAERSRVVLKAVKQRRPHLLAAIAKRKAHVAENTKTKTKTTR